MDFLIVVMGFSAVMFASYSIVLIKQIYDIYRLRKDYSAIPLKKISTLDVKSGYVRIKGVVEPFAESMRSFINDLNVSYFRLIAVPQKRALRLFEKRKAISFYISDGTGKILVLPSNVRFIVNRSNIDGKDVTKDITELLPEKFNPENFKIWEEFLENGSEVTLIGNVSEDKDGNCFISKQKKPLVVSQCSDEAFMLIHFRFLMRLILLFSAMALTSITQFYFLFLL